MARPSEGDDGLFVFKRREVNVPTFFRLIVDD
jgi:hypothetical protein